MAESGSNSQNTPSPTPAGGAKSGGGGFSWAVVLLSVVLLVQLGWLLYTFRQPRTTTGGQAPVPTGAPGFNAAPNSVTLAPTSAPPNGRPPSGFQSGMPMAPTSAPPPSGAPMMGSPAMFIAMPQLAYGLASLSGENALTAEQLKKFQPLVEQMASNLTTTQTQVFDILRLLTDEQRKALSDPTMRPNILPQADGTKDPVVGAAIDAVKRKAGDTAATPQAVDENALRMMPTDRWMVMNGLINLEKSSTPLSPGQAKAVLTILEAMQTEISAYREAQNKLAEGLTPAQAVAVQKVQPPSIDTLAAQLLVTLVK